MTDVFSLPDDGVIADDVPIGTFLSGPSFWFPERLVLSAWLEHAPFAFWLVDAIRPRVLVELGTHHGFSYLAFCQAVQRMGLGTRCHAVDSWAGDAHTGAYGDDVFATLNAYHQPRYAGFSTLMRMQFQSALAHFADGSVDLLHIDGQHEYDDVRRDFEAWLPKLSRRGVVLFHDINVRQGTFGVARFWDELRQRYPGFAFQHGFGLGVLGTGPDVPELLVRLFALDGRPAASVAQAYARLGAAVTAQYGVEGQSGLVAQLQDTARTLQIREAERANDAQLLARLRAELLAAKASDGATRATVSRLQVEAAYLRDEMGKRDDVVRVIQGDAAGVRKLLAIREASIAALQADIPARDAATAHQLAVQAAAAAHERAVEAAGAAHQLAVRDAAIAGLREHLGKLDAKLRRSTGTLAALRGSWAWRVLRTLRRTAPIPPDVLPPDLYAGMRGKRRLRRHRPVLAGSKLFDRDWYLQAYPDVAAAGLDPLEHFLRHGPRDRRNPGPAFDTGFYLSSRPDVEASGLNPLIHYIQNGLAEGQDAVPPLDPAAPLLPPAPPPEASSEAPPVDQPVLDVPGVAELVAWAFPDLRPFPIFTVPGETRRRVTMVTDSVNADSLYGGVATGLVLSALLARRLDAELRILTRAEVADPGRVGTALSSSGVPWDGNIAFTCSPATPDARGVDVRDNEHFVTTSWWGTSSMLQSVGPERLTYLLQEDERMFYPHGDARLRCEELLNEPRLRLAVNSKLLFDHLAATGIAGLADRACWFEPAFPGEHPPTADGPPAGPLNFFFYARPNHARNLYLRGLEALSAAIEDGRLDPARWTIHFVGGSGPVALPRGVQPVIVPPLPRDEYVALTRRMHAGLSLMYTPHPSYPPLDLAASGAVVVTNRYGTKTSLDAYSPNILCVEPDVASLSEAIGVAAQRAEAGRPATRQAPPQDWSAALSAIVERLAG